MGEGPFLDSPLRMCLTKEFLAGSGMRASSGNAAALMMYLKAHCGLEIENDSLSSVGADVPFLAGDADLALVEGLGEKDPAAGPSERPEVGHRVPVLEIRHIRRVQGDR